MFARLARKPTVEVLSIDAGSSRTRCLAFGRLNNDSPIELLSYADEPSSGWVKGRIADKKAAHESISRTILKVSQGRKIKAPMVACGFGSPGVYGRRNLFTLDFGDTRVIQASDVSAAISNSGQMPTSNTENTLSLLPQHWQVDGRRVTKPIGEIGSHITCTAFDIVVPSQALEELESTIGRLQFANPVSFQFEAIAASRSVLSSSEFKKGALVIDIGAQNSGLAAWQDGNLVAASGIPIGGDHFTRDVAHILHVSFEDAEELKIQYGLASKWAPIPQDEDASVLPKLHFALEARARDFLEMVRVYWSGRGGQVGWGK